MHQTSRSSRLHLALSSLPKILPLLWGELAYCDILSPTLAAEAANSMVINSHQRWHAAYIGRVSERTSKIRPDCKDAYHTSVFGARKIIKEGKLSGEEGGGVYSRIFSAAHASLVKLGKRARTGVSVLALTSLALCLPSSSRLPAEYAGAGLGS